jgi:hypothetical protein
LESYPKVTKVALFTNEMMWCDIRMTGSDMTSSEAITSFKSKACCRRHHLQQDHMDPATATASDKVQKLNSSKGAHALNGNGEAGVNSGTSCLNDVICSACMAARPASGGPVGPYDARVWGLLQVGNAEAST